MALLSGSPIRRSLSRFRKVLEGGEGNGWIHAGVAFRRKSNFGRRGVEESEREREGLRRARIGGQYPLPRGAKNSRGTARRSPSAEQRTEHSKNPGCRPSADGAG